MCEWLWLCARATRYPPRKRARVPEELTLPKPAVPHPFDVPALRWGLIGPGQIARAFVQSVTEFTAQRFVAVASTDIARARSFAADFGIARAYGSYADLLADADIDVVYIATRQEAHVEPALAAIAARKHVLVEKPIAMYPGDVRRIMTAAQSAGVLVMEAMWSTYLPQSYLIRQMLAEGMLGEIRAVQADLGQDLRGQSRSVDPRGGGAILDMGIYPVAFASSLMPEPPVRVDAIGRVNALGLDEESSIRLEYASGAVALAGSNMVAFTSASAWVDGSLLSFSLDRPFFTPTTLTVYRREFSPTPIARWTNPSAIRGHHGLSYQATALARFVAEGLTDSPYRSLAASLQDIEIMTAARMQLGARYPDEPEHSVRW